MPIGCLLGYLKYVLHGSISSSQQHPTLHAGASSSQQIQGLQLLGKILAVNSPLPPADVKGVSISTKPVVSVDISDTKAFVETLTHSP